MGRQDQTGLSEPCGRAEIHLPQEHLLQMPQSNRRVFSHIVVASHARVAKSAERAWGSLTRHFHQRLKAQTDTCEVPRHVIFPIGLSVGCLIPLTRPMKLKCSILTPCYRTHCPSVPRALEIKEQWQGTTQTGKKLGKRQEWTHVYS